MSPTVKLVIEFLEKFGYQVVKVPECNKKEPHGRHGLKTKTFICEGKEPIPHGYHSSHQGSFGMWVSCICGHSFACYTFGTDEDTPWKKHQKEYGLKDIPIDCPRCSHSWRSHNRIIGCYASSPFDRDERCGCKLDAHKFELGLV